MYLHARNAQPLQQIIFTTIQRKDGVPQTDMSYYDEIEGAAGNVVCMPMKDNPSYSVPEVMCTL